MRPSHRAPNEMRSIRITRKYTKYAEGSVLVEFGETKVICTASVSDTVPRFLKDSGQGWITAEYGMLPRATHDRTDREASKGKQGGRTVEIQRLIGRSLRAAVDLKLLGERVITIDCDVIQADGGTRTASITGGCVALVEALNVLQARNLVKKNPLKNFIASISVGIYQGTPILDLDYEEDSKADTDMNVVMTDQLGFVELQGTAEKGIFQKHELDEMINLAQEGIKQLIAKQKEALGY